MASQVVFSARTLKHPVPLWREPLVVPAYLAAFSAVVLLIQLAWSSKTIKRLVRRIFRLNNSYSEDSVQPSSSNGTSLVNSTNTSTRNSEYTGAGFFSDAKQKIKQQGILAFVLKVIRAISCLALLAITIIAFVQYEDNANDVDSIDGSFVDALKKGWGKHGKKKHRREREREFIHHAEWIEVALCAFYTYASLLALLSLTLRRPTRSTVTTHLIILLFSVFCIYAYRDIWPLATFTLEPADIAGGWLTWSRVAILGVASVVLPLITPREYVPVDPKNPSVEPNPEQTASPLAFMLFTFLDPIVFTAYKLPHLPYDKLPPLADYDYSAHLRATSFPKLDPTLRPNKKPRHIFFGLMEQFRGEYLFLTASMAIRTILGFASPIGVNRLLNYIENHGEGAVVRPWVWIIILFLSPLAASILMQLYIFIATRLLVRTEGILTQLIFEHSLRIRMKEETPGKTPKAEGELSTPATPRTPSTALPLTAEDDAVTEGGASVDGSTAVGSTAVSTANGSGKKADGTSESSGTATPPITPSADKEKEKDSGDAKNSNLVGKINNLISTDLENITDGRDFLFVVLYAPLQIILCVWFLYTILGWSALVGMGLMILGFPIPGKIAQLTHGVQVERMKKTDERVQSVTETMNVLRMIKMFGWEGKVEDQMKEKREVELTWIRKKYFLQLMNMVVNYVLPLITMLSTFVTYTLIMGQPLTAATVRIFFHTAYYDSV